MMHIATLIGGEHDGKKIAVGKTVDHVDMPDQGGRRTGATVRYRKKMWSRRLDEASHELKTDAFFVLDRWSEQEATTALIAHLRKHNP
jgi:hypothetical protein